MNNEGQTQNSTDTAEDMDTDTDASPVPEQTATEKGDDDDDDDDVPLVKAISTAPTRPKTIISAEKMQQLTLMKTFLVDAVKFIEQIHKSIPIVIQLLSSKSKLEVVEAMDFFMTAYLYKINMAKVKKKKKSVAGDTTVTDSSCCCFIF
jgi:condensin complex subunit 1